MKWPFAILGKGSHHELPSGSCVSNLIRKWIADNNMSAILMKMPEHTQNACVLLAAKSRSPVNTAAGSDHQLNRDQASLPGLLRAKTSSVP